MRPSIPVLIAALFAGCAGTATDYMAPTTSTSRSASVSGQAPNVTDELGPECVEGQTTGCFTSCHTLGTRPCVEGMWSWTCQPPAEQCSNGIDDDCDELTDAQDPDCQTCTPGQTRACTTSCGSTGHEDCEAGGHWESTCRPPPEQCSNGSDDDCDGFVDAADSDCHTCTPGQTRACSTSCGSTGRQDCEGGGDWGSCQPPAEICDNGVDDDCDGAVDHHDHNCPTILHTCESEEGGGCNGDLGYGDHCAAADNTGGCTAARFNAWCNRRNPATPNIWDDWVRNWVDSRCDGTVAETGTQYSTWYCVSSTNDRYECTTPLVLSFDGAAVQLDPPSATPFAFRPGEPVTSSWPRAQNPWLVRDLDGDGRITDGSELFGSNTRLADGTLAPQGFAALEALDANHDGVLDLRDPAFASLRLWADVNGDRHTDRGELKTLAEAGVRALGLRFTLAPRCDDRGNCERERAPFRWVDLAGEVHAGAVVDVYLATRPAQRDQLALACIGPEAAR